MSSKRKLTTLFVLSGVLFFSGCGTAIENLNAFKQDHIQKSEVMPSAKEITSGKHKVIIMDVEGYGVSSQLGQTLTREIESEIVSDQSVELLDRAASNRFKREIKLSEMNGVSTNDNVLLQSADYAIVGELRKASFTSQYVKRTVGVDGNGKKFEVPSHFIYKAEVSGQIKIYELPSMKIKKTVPFSATKTRAEDSNYGNRGLKSDPALVSKAAVAGIHKAKYEIKNFLTPKGYLIGARSLDSDRIIRLSLGSNNGIKEGDKIEIFTKTIVVNQLTDKEMVEERKIGFATVSDQIDSTTSYARLDSVNEGDTIHIGDRVSVLYEKSFMENFKR